MTYLNTLTRDIGAAFIAVPLIIILMLAAIGVYFAGFAIASLAGFPVIAGAIFGVAWAFAVHLGLCKVGAI